jgi:hypothetical protein
MISGRVQQQVVVVVAVITTTWSTTTTTITVAIARVAVACRRRCLGSLLNLPSVSGVCSWSIEVAVIIQSLVDGLLNLQTVPRVCRESTERAVTVQSLQAAFWTCCVHPESAVNSVQRLQSQSLHRTVMYCNNSAEQAWQHTHCWWLLDLSCVELVEYQLWWPESGSLACYCCLTLWFSSVVLFCKVESHVWLTNHKCNCAVETFERKVDMIF